MKTKSISILAALLVATVGSGPVQAGEQGYPPFSEVDKDKDGYISAKEAKAVPGLSEYRTALDQDGDGKLSPKEYDNLRTLAPKKGDSKLPAPITPPAPVPVQP